MLKVSIKELAALTDTSFTNVRQKLQIANVPCEKNDKGHNIYNSNIALEAIYSSNKSNAPNSINAARIRDLNAKAAKTEFELEVLQSKHVRVDLLSQIITDFATTLVTAVKKLDGVTMNAGHINALIDIIKALPSRLKDETNVG